MSDVYRMKSKNPVLLKDDVGKAKPSIYDLPHESHAYGRAEQPDLEGAREVTMHWAAHVPRAKPGPLSQDFKKLNKLAAQSGVASSKGLAEFRKENDVKLMPAGPVGCLPKVIPSDVIPSFAYGQKSRPSTPIHHVVGGEYAVQSQEAAEAMYAKWDAEKAMVSKHRVKLTKSSSARIVGARERRRAASCSGEPKQEWVMSKFKNVKGKMTPFGRSASLTNIGVAAEEQGKYSSTPPPTPP
jgi:hypothetical protein